MNTNVHPALCGLTPWLSIQTINHGKRWWTALFQQPTDPSAQLIPEIFYQKSLPFLSSMDTIPVLAVSVQRLISDQLLHTLGVDIHSFGYALMYTSLTGFFLMVEKTEGKRG